VYILPRLVTFIILGVPWKQFCGSQILRDLVWVVGNYIESKLFYTSHSYKVIESSFHAIDIFQLIVWVANITQVASYAMACMRLSTSQVTQRIVSKSLIFYPCYNLICILHSLPSPMGADVEHYLTFYTSYWQQVLPPPPPPPRHLPTTQSVTARKIYLGHDLHRLLTEARVLVLETNIADVSMSLVRNNTSSLPNVLSAISSSHGASSGGWREFWSKMQFRSC